jgi:hypothetical protein
VGPTGRPCYFAKKRPLKEDTAAANLILVCYQGEPCTPTTPRRRAPAATCTATSSAAALCGLASPTAPGAQAQGRPRAGRAGGRHPRRVPCLRPQGKERDAGGAADHCGWWWGSLPCGAARRAPRGCGDRFREEADTRQQLPCLPRRPELAELSCVTITSC